MYREILQKYIGGNLRYISLGWTRIHPFKNFYETAGAGLQPVTGEAGRLSLWASLASDSARCGKAGTQGLSQDSILRQRNPDNRDVGRYEKKNRQIDKMKNKTFSIN